MRLRLPRIPTPSKSRSACNSHRGPLGYYRARLLAEMLEDRRMLSMAISDPAIELFSVSPALFVENQGQWADESVRYVHNGNGVNVAMTETGPVFQVIRREAKQEQAEGDLGREELGGFPPGLRDRFERDEYVTETLVFSASFIGAREVLPVGLEKSETVFNYFVSEEANWRTAVPNYEVVAYGGLYDGIDLRTWGRRSSLKYEFHVAPGADWSQIQIRYDGIAGLSLGEDGSLVVDLGEDSGSLVDDAPYVYQLIDGHEVVVAARFVLLDEWTYTFDITGAFQPTQPLVIDPDLAWSRYLGGSGGEGQWLGGGIAVDAAGNAIITGTTYSTDFAETNNTHMGGGVDAFVAKVSPDGMVQWATYVGGGGTDYGNGIAVDISSNALVTGGTGSTDFAGANNELNVGSQGQDAFVAQLSASGALQWATYLGGGDSEDGFGIAVDAACNALVTGVTASTDFPAANNTYKGGYDVFLTRVSASGVLEWTTYLGGSNREYGFGVAADAAGDALVTGITWSTNFAGANNTHNGGGEDAFTVKVSSNGTLQWASYLGGSKFDEAFGVAVGVAGNVMVTGVTASLDFPGAYNSPEGGSDAFVAKFSSGGILQWSTYLGGSLSGDIGYAIAVDGGGHAFVAGRSWSDDLSGSNNTYKGESDAFLAKVSTGGILQWATYLGGSNSDEAFGIAVDALGNALVMGYTSSVDFGGTLNDYRGGGDAFVAKIQLSNAAPAMRIQEFRLFTDESRSTPGLVGSYIDANLRGYLPQDDWRETQTIAGTRLDATIAFADPAWGSRAQVALTSGSDENWDLFSVQWDGYIEILVDQTRLRTWSDDGSRMWIDINRDSHFATSGDELIDNNWGSGQVVTHGPLCVPLEAGLYPIRIQYEEGFGGAIIHLLTGTPPFEALARDVAYRDWDEWTLHTPIVSQDSTLTYVIPYTLARVFRDDASGFYAVGLQSVDFGPALAIRGTELPLSLSSLHDVWADADGKGVGYYQFAANWKAGESVFSWLKTLSTPADIVGHSLGGAVAQWIAAAYTSDPYGGQIDNLVTFNSPGISNSASKHPALIAYAHEFDPAKANGVIHYIVNGDVVSLAGEAFVAGEVRMASFSEPDRSMWSFYKHSRPLTVPSVADRHDRSWDYDVSVDALNDPLFRYTDRDYALWVLDMQMRLHEKRVYSLVDLPARLLLRGKTEEARQYIGTIRSKIDDAAEFAGWRVAPDGSFIRDSTAHFELSRITLTPGFSLGIDSLLPPMLDYDGGLSVALGREINISLPSWMGGDFHANYLLELAGMDYGGAIERDHLEIKGSLALLGDLAEVDGLAVLDWRQNEVSLSGGINVLDGFITATIATRIGTNLDFVLQGAADMRIPDSVPWIGGTQIVGGNFLLNYVNDSIPSNDFIAGWGTVGGLPLGLRVRFNGDWDILGANEIVGLQPQGAQTFGATEMRQVELGMALEQESAPYTESYSIPAETGWALFLLKRENPSTAVEFYLQTPSGQVLSEADIAADPSMGLVAELTNDYRKAVRVDVPEAGEWLLTIDDTTELGTVDMGALISQPLPAVSVVIVSGGVLREPVEIRIATSSADPDARVALFYDNDQEGVDGIMIADGLVPDGGGAIDYTWDTSGVAAAEYRLYARALDGVNMPVYAYADQAVQITDPVPVVTSLVASPDPVVQSGKLTLTADVAFDPLDDLLQVELYDGEDMVGVDVDGSDGWSWSVDTANWALGVHTLSARAQDFGGDWSEWVSVALTVTLYTVETFTDPNTGNLEYKLSYDGFHFATVLQTPAGAISFRGHPDQNEPNGWGSTVQENVFIAGAGVDATGGEVTSAVVDTGGIQVSAGGDVPSAGGSAGTWTWTSTITYDPSQLAVTAAGTTTVTLAAALAGHMNVGRTSSNYLYDYPLNGGGRGPTGDMKSMTFAYGPDAGVGQIQWTPLPGLEGTSPQDASDNLAVTVWGQINRSDPLQTAVAKPTLQRQIVSSDSTTRLIVAAFWDSTKVGYQFDNVGVAPVVLPQNTQATSFVFQTTESWTLPDPANPTVTANSLTTASDTPTLTGTVNPSSSGKPVSQVTVVLVGSQTRLTLPATIDDMDWSVAISTPLAAGTYQVQATATDTGGNTAFSTTELTIAAPEFLGTVDFAEVTSHDLSAGDAWYRLLASRDGWLTVQAFRDDVEIAIFDSMWESMPTTALMDGIQRLEERAAAGETFYVRVSGVSGTVDLRFVNLVQHEGTTVTVRGTVQGDAFVFDASSAIRQVTIKGVPYEFSEAQADTFVFDGLGGNDDVQVVGGGAADTAVLRPSAAFIRGSGYSLAAVSIESSTFDGGGGEDLARLYRSHRANAFALGGDGTAVGIHRAALRGGGVDVTATAEHVYAKGNGGKDTAELHKLADSDRFEAFWRRAQVTGEGHTCCVFDFRSAVVLESDGGDPVGLFVLDGDRPLHSQGVEKTALIDAVVGQAGGEVPKSLAVDELAQLLWLHECEKQRSTDAPLTSTKAAEFDKIFAYWE